MYNDMGFPNPHRRKSQKLFGEIVLSVCSILEMLLAGMFVTLCLRCKDGGAFMVKHGGGSQLLFCVDIGTAGPRRWTLNIDIEPSQAHWGTLL